MEYLARHGAQPLCDFTARVANRSARESAPMAKSTPSKRPLARTVVFEQPHERERRLDAKVGVETREVYDNMRKRETWIYNPDAEYLKVCAPQVAGG